MTMTQEQAAELLAQGRRTERLLEQLVVAQQATATAQQATSTEIAALRLAPSLIRLVVVLLIVGLLALGIVGAAQVSLEGYGLKGGVSPVVLPGRP